MVPGAGEQRVVLERGGSAQVNVTVRRVPARELAARAEGIRAVYAEAFCAPPWDEDPASADAYLARLESDAARPGFVAALAEAEDGGVLGFTTAWPTPRPFPTGRNYPRAAEAVGGPERAEAWLGGSRQIDELAVRPSGRGLGAALLAAISEDAPDGRCWLLTSALNPHAIAFYRRQGWGRINRPDPPDDGIVVFLGPRHPARRARTAPSSSMPSPSMPSPSMPSPSAAGGTRQ